MSRIGKNIKKIRTVKNLNQQDLATFLGLSRASIGAYEEERAEPKIDSLIKLADHYNLDLGRLINSELTVNEIHGFKQVEHFVTNEVEEIIPPAKIKEIAYYHLKNGNLVKQEAKVCWPINGNGNFLAVQITVDSCLIFQKVELHNLETNLEFAYSHKSSLKFDTLTGISKDQLKLSKTTLPIEEINSKIFQPVKGQGNLEQKINRLEKIVTTLL